MRKLINPQETCGTKLPFLLKALGRSAEERQLLERYTRQLDQQENRLEAVQRELAGKTREHDRTSQELARLIGEVVFEVTDSGRR